LSSECLTSTELTLLGSFKHFIALAFSVQAECFPVAITDFLLLFCKSPKCSHLFQVPFVSPRSFAVKKCDHFQTSMTITKAKTGARELVLNSVAELLAMLVLGFNFPPEV